MTHTSHTTPRHHTVTHNLNKQTMEPEIYNKITETIRTHRASCSKTCLKTLERTFANVSHNTLYSIVRLEYQRRMKRNHLSNQQNTNKYYDLYKEAAKRGEKRIILRLSDEFDICPSLIAKLILQKYCQERYENNVQEKMRDPNLIPDVALANEVYTATLNDAVYGPFSDTAKSSLGQQYEVRLLQEAVKLGLAFRDEEYLRKKGFDKTPDLKLDVPIVIDGCVIHWIESKALFGDQEAHADYVREQYSSYWNRFGPGLVIYWFGFLKTVADSSEKRFIVRDHLPTNFTSLLEVLPFIDNGTGDNKSCSAKTLQMFQEK